MPLLAFLAIFHAAYAQTNDTISVYFDLNISGLDTNKQKGIDLLINNKLSKNSFIKIYGYADFPGTEDHNKTLSVQRSENVKTYLLDHGISTRDIKLCIGKGQVNRKTAKNKDGYPTDRRVDIVICREIKQQSGDKLYSFPKQDILIAKQDSLVVIKKVVITVYKPSC